jgi:hypothetical protein
MFAVPPAPVHESSNVAFDVNAAVCSEPAVAFAPLHGPLAVHVVAPVVVHCSVVRLPDVIEAGFALSVTVGGAGDSSTFNA